ncbi:MAG TPA: alpha/beta fold hydrolase [Gemmatimonadales bacterium]|nr:alpha/beta fold hydrolase [Gemmatimonadales bacterium]
MLAPLEMSVPAADGLILKGTLTYPTGRPGELLPLAVLAHQYPATRDSFAPLVRDLLAAGVATLAFDQRGHGASLVGPKGPVVVDAPEGLGAEAFGTAFVASAQRVEFARIENDVIRVTGWGASQNFIDPARLALVGASVGGPGVLLAAPSLPGLRGVATVGAAGAPAFGPDGPERVRRAVERLALPVWLGSSAGDPFEGGANVTRWSKDLSHVTARVVPGTAHAMAIYFDVRDELVSFLRRALSVA